VIVEGIFTAQVVYQTNDPDSACGKLSGGFSFQSCTMEIDGVQADMDCESEAIVENVSHTAWRRMRLS
jgi:hypothetical protein